MSNRNAFVFSGESVATRVRLCRARRPDAFVRVRDVGARGYT